MPAIPLATGDAHRAYGKLPRLQLRNLFPENDVSNGATGITYLQRPGLAPLATLGGGPVDTVWRQIGTFGGDHLASSAGILYRVTQSGVATTIGNIAAGRAQVAASTTRAIIVSGGVAHSTDGSTLSVVAMPGGEAVSGVAFLSGFFVLVVADTQRFFWIAPGETNPDPLSFAEAERSPDAIVSPAVVGDEVWFLGQSGEEVWTLTGDIDAPFQRTNGRVYENGCAARDSVVEVDTALLWVASDFDVMLAQGAPQSVATPAIVEHLRLSDPATLRAWTFKLDTHTFYVLTSNIDTFALDLSTKTWMRFSSLNRETWRAHLGAYGVCGDSDSGKLWTVAPGRCNDDGLQMAREISGGIENPGAPARCDSVAVRMAVGWSPSPSFEPVVEMRSSSDEGATWTGWAARGLGRQGRYDKHVVWRRQGLIKAPGRLWEWRMTDDALWRLSSAAYNEAFS